LRQGSGGEWGGWCLCGLLRRAGCDESKEAEEQDERAQGVARDCGELGRAGVTDRRGKACAAHGEILLVHTNGRRGRLWLEGFRSRVGRRRLLRYSSDGSDGIGGRLVAVGILLIVWEGESANEAV
jgi:hypothetical protein